MSEGQKFRKRPVVINAIMWTGGNSDDIVKFCGGAASVDDMASGRQAMVIATLEGDMAAMPGDWIIRGVKGEFYPCKPDIFALTYEAHHE